MIILINGCFSSGKSTVARAVSESIEGCCVVDPDTFASFRPPNPPDGFDSYDFTWGLVGEAVRGIVSRGMHCVMQVVLAPGISSTDPSDLLGRLEAISPDISAFTLLPSLERVRKQNEERTDVVYPDDVLERCWQAVRKKECRLGTPLPVGDSESAEEMAQRILDFIHG